LSTKRAIQHTIAIDVITLHQLIFNALDGISVEINGNDESTQYPVDKTGWFINEKKINF